MCRRATSPDVLDVCLVIEGVCNGSVHGASGHENCAVVAGAFERGGFSVSCSERRMILVKFGHEGQIKGLIRGRVVRIHGNRQVRTVGKGLFDGIEAWIVIVQGRRPFPCLVFGAVDRPAEVKVGVAFVLSPVFGPAILVRVAVLVRVR